MDKEKLGIIKEVDVRLIWQKEDADFTPWLAKNIGRLGHALGLDLIVEAEEKEVGPFRADILCKDEATNNFVLIENQLDITDHKHLGQLLTYANGLDAVTIIWIAPSFAEEHRATLDWLNRITNEEHKFFGVIVKVIEINEEKAPLFEIVSKPNNWSREVASAVSKIERKVSPTRQKLLEFWTNLKDSINSKEGINFTANRKASPRSYYSFSTGVTGVNYLICFSPTIKRLSVEIYISGDQQIGRELFKDKDDIEAELGMELVWKNVDSDTDTRIRIEKWDAILENEDDWDIYIDWIIEKLSKFRSVFSNRLKSV